MQCEINSYVKSACFAGFLSAMLPCSFEHEPRYPRGEQDSIEVIEFVLDPTGVHIAKDDLAPFAVRSTIIDFDGHRAHYGEFEIGKRETPLITGLALPLVHDLGVEEHQRGISFAFPLEDERPIGEATLVRRQTERAMMIHRLDQIIGQDSRVYGRVLEIELRYCIFE